MKRAFFLAFAVSTLAALLVVSFAHADAVATLTCTGAKVTLSVRTPYLGENSPFAQELYVLKANDAANEFERTAYFLDIDMLTGTASYGGAGNLIYLGSNKAGGSFELIIAPWKDESTGGVIRETSSGLISYDHGPLFSLDEPVSCVKE